MEMPYKCEIYVKFLVLKRKICAATLIFSLICGWTPTAESISVKLRGKIALAGMLSGLAYATHLLVKRDRRATEKLESRLGPPDRVVQFERGFDLWRINYYRKQCYLFRNNRFIKTVPCVNLRSQYQGYKYQTHVHLKTDMYKSMSPFLIDTPVLGNPKWLQLYHLHPLQAPRLVSSDLYRLGDEDLLRSLLSCSSRRLGLSWWHLHARRYEAPSSPLP